VDREVVEGLAFADLGEAIRLEPRSAEAYFLRGSIGLRPRPGADPDGMPLPVAAGRARALADLSEAIRLDPGHAEYHFGRGNAWERGDDRELEDYNEAVRLDRGLDRSRSAEYRSCRGMAYHERGEWDRALADLDEAIRLDPDRFSYDSNRAPWSMAPGAIMPGPKPTGRVARNSRQGRPPQARGEPLAPR
jgi:tetratricopeptide (TPR) repeat protein